MDIGLDQTGISAFDNEYSDSKNIDAVSTTQGLDPVFFDVAFKKLSDRLFSYASSFVPKETAEDIVADTFAYWWKSNKTFDRNMDHLRGYLFMAVRHRCFKWLKLQERESTTIKYLSTQPDDEPYSVKEAVLLKIEDEINKLPSQCKRIFNLYHFNNLSEKEIAVLLKISPNTVRNQKARAIAKLKVALKGTSALFVLEIMMAHTDSATNLWLSCKIPETLFLN